MTKIVELATDYIGKKIIAAQYDIEKSIYILTLDDETKLYIYKLLSDSFVYDKYLRDN